MKFTTTARTDKRAPLTIPGDFLHTVGLDGKLRLDLQPGVAVLASPTTDQGKMDAMLSLLSIVNEMMGEIIAEHGGAPAAQDSCVDCCSCRPSEEEPFFEDCGNCEHRPICDERVSLPLCWLEDAGLPFFGDLRIVCEEGRIVITGAGDKDGEDDLRDETAERKRLVYLLEQSGICPDRARTLLDGICA